MHTQERVQESTLHKIAYVDHTAQEPPKKKQAFNEPICLNAENSLPYEVECLKIETEEERALIEDMREEAVKTTQIHQTTVQLEKSQGPPRYLNKNERHSRGLEVI